ncbi:DUF6318 family protein [Kribbella sp. NPDC051718]|uniref:DUF6318 family protein n=1 Tax=Kribbella sp. NPDC051718 TaxID=3155168 RepID=UPI003416E28D
MTTRNRQATALTLTCLCAAALLTACTNKSPEAGQPNTAPPSTSTTGASSTPSTSSPVSPSVAGTPPKRPSDADGLTLAAAESFVRYYSALLNYASDTGQTTELLASSDSGCHRCKAYADFVAKSNAKNGGLSGDYHEQLKEVSELVRGTNGRLGGSATIVIGAYVSKETPTSEPVSTKATTYKRELALSPQGGNWVMYEMKLVAQ